MLSPERLHALLAVCEDRTAVKADLEEVSTENLQEFVTVSASLMADRRPDVLALMVRSLSEGCVTGEGGKALLNAAMFVIHGLGSRHPLEECDE